MDVGRSNLGELKSGLEDKPPPENAAVQVTGVQKELTRLLDEGFQQAYGHEVPHDIHLELQQILTQLITPRMLLSVPPDELHYLVQAITLEAMDFHRQREFGGGMPGGGQFTTAHLHQKVRANPVVRRFVDLHHQSEDSQVVAVQHENGAVVHRPKHEIMGGALHNGTIHGPHFAYARAFAGGP